jgi:hypothetical protein
MQNPYNPNLWFNQKSKEKTYHIVYLTTNIVNQKIYVGVHSTNNLNDRYLGSGKTMRSAIKKFGENNFKRIILYQCLSRQDACIIENQIIDQYFINRKDIYNIMLGGGNLYGTHNETTKNIISLKNKGLIRSDEFKNKVSKTLTGIKRGPMSTEHKKNVGASISKSTKGKSKSAEHIAKVKAAITGLKATESAKENMRIARNLFWINQHKFIILFIATIISNNDLDRIIKKYYTKNENFSRNSMKYQWNKIFPNSV